MTYTGSVIVTGEVTGTATWNLEVTTGSQGVCTIAGSIIVNGDVYTIEESIAFTV